MHSEGSAFVRIALVWSAYFAVFPVPNLCFLGNQALVWSMFVSMMSRISSSSAAAFSKTPIIVYWLNKSRQYVEHTSLDPA